MIPFSGFMQAVTDSVPVFGDKTVNIGKNIHGLPENDDAILSSDDNTRSFLALVQTLMDSGAAGATDGESVFDIQNGDRESDWPTLDQLKTLIAEAMDQTPVGQDIAQPLNTERLDDGHVVFPQGMINHAHKVSSVIQKTATSEDNTANSQDNAKNGQRQRIDLANVNGNELTKDQSPDSVKNSLPELTKAAPSFQDTAKAMAADPSTTMAVKQTANPSVELTRTEASAVKTFQTTVMDQLVDKAAIRSIHGRSEIQIRLKPEFLGNVQVNIATDKDQLVVRIVTDQPLVKEIIETHLHHLKAELKNQGLTIDKFDVTVNPDADQQHSRESFAQMYKNHSSPNGRRQPQEQNPKTHHRGDGNESDDDTRNREGVNYFA